MDDHLAIARDYWNRAVLVDDDRVILDAIAAASLAIAEELRTMNDRALLDSMTEPVPKHANRS